MTLPSGSPPDRHETIALRQPAAVLFDRDGTLCVDVPYNGRTDRVLPTPTAVEALALLRAAGVPTAVVSNQSGVRRGLLSLDQVSAVNRRLDELLGGIGPVFVCPHVPSDGCGCRKPAPGLLLAAAGRLGVRPADCALIGDIGADMDAAAAVCARAVLVPTPATRAAEVEAAPEVAPNLLTAVGVLLAPVPRTAPPERTPAERTPAGRRGAEAAR